MTTSIAAEPLPDAASETTLCAAFQAAAAAHPERGALRSVDGSVELSWADYAAQVRRVAGGLAALGVRAGDTVALMMRNRPEFNIVDAAAMHLGAVPWSIYNTSSAEQIRFLVGNAGSRVVVAEEAFADRLENAVRGLGVEQLVRAEALDELPAAPAGFDFEVHWRQVAPADVLTIIYTSGTTGDPKGVELTHAGMAATLEAATKVSGVSAGGRGTSYLPAAHVADRWTAHYWSMTLGMTLTCVADPTAIIASLPRVRPTIWGSVPRVWEKLRASLEAGFAGEPDVEKRSTIANALEVCLRCVRAEQRGDGIPAELADARARADEAVFAPLREKLGLDQVEWLVVGAAPLAPETLEFFAAIGLPLSEVWGMSETCGLLTLNPSDDRRFGTVGPPVPGVELRLAEDGEVLARGPMLMRGYRDQPELTAETIDPDGWLHTGDIGALEDGYLRIVDRKKELIINAAGKNMSPLAIEGDLKTSGPLIGQACVIGDRRPYNVALLVADPDGLASWASAHGRDGATIAELSGDQELLADVAAEVEAANRRLSRVEQIKRWRLLDSDWPPDGDELTPTMKLKRRAIAAKYADVIEEVYAV